MPRLRGGARHESTPVIFVRTLQSPAAYSDKTRILVVGTARVAHRHRGFTRPKLRGAGYIEPRAVSARGSGRRSARPARGPPGGSSFRAGRWPTGRSAPRPASADT